MYDKLKQTIKFTIDMNRYESDDTKKELISSLYFIFPVSSVLKQTKEDIVSELSLSENNREGGQYLFWSENKKRIVVAFYDNENPKNVYNGFLLEVHNKPQNLDLSFGNCFCRVFNDDTKILPSEVTHSEIWMALRQTQFIRAIAKFSSFSSEPLIKWLQIVEESTSLKYEGKPFSFCLFMTKRKEWIQNPLSKSFFPFSSPIPFEKGIMAEKWLRGSMCGQTVGIAGHGHAGQLFGMFAIPTQLTEETDTLLSPHDELIPIINLLVAGTCMLLTTENGDIYFILPNRATFYKTQGRWHYLNYSNIQKVLSELYKEEIASAILRLSLNLSFKRHGALILIPDRNEDTLEIIPDHNQRKRVNSTLRGTINGLNICDKTQRKIIMSSAKIDGSLVVSADGQVLDVSCMIGQPTKERLAELNITKLERFPGARSTAAWNASIYGTALKISEDGPITIFRHGKLIAQVG